MENEKMVRKVVPFLEYLEMAEAESKLDTHASLLVRLRNASDVDAWHAFAATYVPLVYGFCRGRGLQDADAADVAQEVLVQVVRSIRSFEYDPGRGRFRDWLGTVTRNKLIRFVKKHAAPQGAAGVADQTSAAGAVDAEWIDAFHAHVLKVAIERIRGHFEPHTWRAFELVWMEDRPAPDVARELAQPVDFVYVAKSRVLKRLRDEVKLIAEDIPGYGSAGE